MSFVGSGPGDPGLLTLRAAALLAEADIVILDRVLRGPALTGLVRPGAEVVEGSLADDGTPLSQSARSKRLVDAAKHAARVVRLMDGDPATFTGLVEEAAACRKAGVAYEIVPGVSAVSAVPAYAGIPLTDARSRSVHVVKGHMAHVDWASHAQPDATVVVVGDADAVADAALSLVGAGRDAATPIAVTSQGTTTAQRTVVSTLGDVNRALRGARLAEPVLAVVGEVVAHREGLSWFESKPLFGWQVLVPRTKEQAGALSAELRRHGAVPHEVPTISVEPPRTPQQMERAIKTLFEGDYQWIAFTSVNALRAVREKLEEFGLDARVFAGVKVAAVGEQTAAALRAFGVVPDLVPCGEQSGAGLLEDWPEFDDDHEGGRPRNRVFLPRADIATETLAAGLVELGWEIDDVTAYRTVRAAPPPAETREAIKTGGFDAVVFTSSSTVRNLVGIAGKPHASTAIVCIGPQTAKTAEEHGLRVDVLAPAPSVAALTEALAEYGASLRLAALEHGEAVWRPSQRKGARRSKAK